MLFSSQVSGFSSLCGVTGGNTEYPRPCPFGLTPQAPCPALPASCSARLVQPLSIPQSHVFRDCPHPTPRPSSLTKNPSLLPHYQGTFSATVARSQASPTHCSLASRPCLQLTRASLRPECLLLGRFICGQHVSAPHKDLPSSHSQQPS
jgi:hypothetical protein